jgi:hypothetical protein
MVTKTAKGDAGASTSAAAMDEHDVWLEGVDTSHIKPLKEDWDKHAFWADEKTVKDPTTEAGKIAAEMASGLTPDERAESCKVRCSLFYYTLCASMGGVYGEKAS